MKFAEQAFVKISFMVLCMLLLVVQTVVTAQSKKPLSLEDFFAAPKFASKNFQAGQWAEKGPVITFVKPDTGGITHLMSYDLKRDEQTVLLDGLKLHAAGLFIALAQVGAQDLSLLKGQVYTVDRAHSLFDFTVQLAGFNRMRGTFKDYDANLYLVENDLTQSSISVVVEVKSVDTGVEDRDEHLRSADFFGSDSFAVMTFQSERIERTKAGFAAVGPLIIRDRKRTVRIPFQVVAPKARDPFGNERISFVGQFVLKRSDFGIVGPRFWNQAISEEVEINFELAGRRWNYFELGWGPKRKKSIGKFLFRTADSLGFETARSEALKLWEQHRDDEAYNFSLFEFQKAAGRLMQRRKIDAAIGVLELAVELRKDAEAAELAYMYARLGEAYARNGKRETAVQNLQRALQLDVHNTYALEVARHLN